MTDLPPAVALQRVKRQALAWLCGVTVVFIATTVLERGLWLNGLKAVAEAAMVGALADWFAVRALFRRVPLPLIGRHTAIIARNKDRIGEQLARFVRDKFLDPDSLAALLRRHDLVERLAQWLVLPANAQLLGQQVTRMAAAALEMLQDRQVEHLIHKAVRTLIGQIDLSRTLATVLGALTHNGRHQALLSDALTHVIAALQNEETRTWMARTIVLWAKKEHPYTEKILPTDWLGNKSAALMAQALENLLADVASNPEHALRARFDGAVHSLIERLQTDPDWARKAEEVRHYLQTDATLGGYVQELWRGMRAALLRDLTDEDSAVARNVRAMGQWLGQSLVRDAPLRHALNERLQDWVRGLAPDVSQFVAQHIQDTVQRWDAQEMADLVELN
ncbi:MAG: DUF445 domain-containing protein, partial [Burkholderiaceae bacterium]|nr:DUF445 domain-containing protein [Burkholderiaceae bacterium]